MSAFYLGRSAVSQDEADRLIEKHRPYAHAIAADVAKTLPYTIDRDELKASAELGLVEAARAFDSSRGVLFKTFAYYRIRGAIYDSLRRLGMLKYAPRLRFDAGANAFMQEQASEGPERADAKAIHAHLQAVTESVVGAYVLSIEALTYELPETGTPSPEQQYDARERRQRLMAALDRLPARNRKVVEDYYFKDRTLDEIGQELGLSKSWVCRLHARALDMLREQLKELAPDRVAQG